MAIRTILLRKKINDQKKVLDQLRAAKADFEKKAADLKTREDELIASVDEVSSEEEQKAVEEAADALEADKAALDTEVSENDQKISDLETEITDMERDLEKLEEEQRTVPPIPTDDKPEETPAKKTTKKSGGKRTMLKCRSLRNMSIVDRDELINREDTQNLLNEVRSAIKEKRALTGGAYTISDTIVGLIREDVIEYSKLYKHVRVYSLSGKGREIVMGTNPEAFWEECCDPIYELEQSLSQVEIDCYKVAGFIPLCNALIEDSDIDLLDEIMVSILQAIGLALDKAIIYGTGVKMPTGVVTAIDDDNALKLTNEITIPTASSTGVKLFQELVKATGVIANRYARGEKVWVMNEATYVTLQAEALSVNAAGAIVTGVDGRMPVGGGVIEVLNFVPAKNIVVGYFDLYVLGERKGMTIDTSEHVRFLQDQTVIRGRARYDGKPAIVKAFAVIGIDNTTPSVEVDFANPSED
ncbi:MAG: phage major capsid protein [Bacteroidales bacterium]|nr:phage major capsid protein [Bacteroidales bacterium]